MKHERKASTTKKNHNRVKVQDRAFFPSMQRNYKSVIRKVETNNEQLKLL